MKKTLTLLCIFLFLLAFVPGGQGRAQPRVFHANLFQIGTEEPETNVLRNDFPVDYQITRIDPGVFRIEAEGHAIFDGQLTSLQISNMGNAVDVTPKRNLALGWLDESALLLFVMDADLNYTDSFAANVLITVYQEAP